MKYFLNFQSDSYGRKSIDEPIGIAEIDFNIKQEQGRMCRDITLNGDVIEFEFTYMRSHEFQQILYYFNKFGFEAKVDLEIIIDDINTYICELDFATAETDDLEYFKCKGLLVADRQVIKRRKSVKVDLFSDKNVDGDYIPPLIPDNTLILASPLKQISKWTSAESISATFVSYGLDEAYLVPVNSIEDSEIKDTLLAFDNYSYYGMIAGESTFPQIFNPIVLLDPTTKLTDVEIKITNFSCSVMDISGITKKRLQIVYSDTFNQGETTVITLESTTGNLILTNQEYIVTIPNLNVNTKVCLFLNAQNYTFRSATPIGSTNMHVSSGVSLEMNVTSTSYSSVVPTVSLYDAMKQVVKSISGLDIVAPRFDVGGSLYGNRLMNGNALRNIPNKPFSVSLDDIEKSLSEMRCDYEIDSNGKVFFGNEVDFYTTTEIGFFPNTQFSEMSKTFNPLYSVNEFYYNFKNYQALKENTLPGTADTIHGESRFVFHNKKVENKKVVDIEWTRDVLLIEELRKIGLVISKNTSTIDDDDLFIIDAILATEDKTFIEVIEVKHTFKGANKLSLKNDSTLNFVTMGILVGSAFEILAPDYNTAIYTVTTSNPSELILTRVSAGTNSSSGNGVRSTSIKYTIDNATVPYINRTNEGFDTISNLNSSDKCINLRYTVGRNIRNFWWSYLSTVNLYWKNETIKNNWYKNNGECTTVYEGITVKEKEDIKPDNPIVSPMMYNKMIFSNVEFFDFVTLQNNLRSQRGFIRAIDNNEKVIKVYPTELMYSMLDRELVVKGEEKYEPKTLNVKTNTFLNPYYSINDETVITKLIYDIKGEKVYFYDLNRQLLYNGVYWHEVAINGALANSKNALIEWLNILTY